MLHAGDIAEKLEKAETSEIHESVNQSTSLMRPSIPLLSICDQRFLCRMAKKLGCQFCANKSL